MERVDRGNCVLISSGKPAAIADERAEGAEVEPGTSSSCACAGRSRAWSANEALRGGEVVHAEPGRERGDAMNGTQMKPAFCSQIARVPAPSAIVCGAPPSAPNRPDGDHQRHHELHQRHAEIAEAGVSPSAEPLRSSGKKKLMLAMVEAKLPPPKPQQQREQQERRVAGRRVLHGEADADRREQQQRGRERGPAPAAEDRHHERVEDAQRRARQPGQRRRARTAGWW